MKWQAYISAPACVPLLIFLLPLSTCLAQQPFSLPGTYTETGTTRTGYYFVPPSSTSTDSIGDGQDHLNGSFLFIASFYGPYCANRIGSGWAPFQFTEPFPPTRDPTDNATFTFTLMADGTYIATDSWQVLYSFGTHQWTDTLTVNLNTGIAKYNYNFTALLNNGQIFKYTQDTTATVSLQPLTMACMIGGGNAPTFTVESLELTQTIQNPADYVPLIAAKPTYVRAYVTSDVPNKTASVSLSATRTAGPGTLGSLFPQLQPENPGLILQQTLDRSKLFQNYVFVLPPDWLTGTVELKLNVATPGVSVACENAISSTFDLAGKLPEFTNSLGHDCKAIAKFNPVPPLKIKLYKIVPIGSSFDDTEVSAAVSDIKQTFPISSLNIQERGTIYWPTAPSTAFGFLLLNYNLALVRELDCYFDCNWIYLGLLPKAAATGVRGLGSIPSLIATAYTNLLSPSHELGHVAGLSHVKYRGDEKAPNLAYPYKDSQGRGVIGGNLSVNPPDDLLYYGFDGRALALSTALKPPITPDLMSYGPSRWPSDYTYDYIRAFVSSQFPFPSSSSSGSTSERTSPNAGSTPVVFVTGSVNLAGASVTGSISSIQTVGNDPGASFGGSGTWTLNELDGTGNILGSLSFEPRITNDDPILGAFAVAVPLAANAARFTLMHSGTLMDSRTASAHPPLVTVTYPNGGENLSGASATFTWIASDADNNPLTFNLQYSPDGGANWQTLAVNLNTTSYTVDLTQLPGTSSGLIRVFANDGFNTTSAQSLHTFNVPNHGPTLRVLTPIANSAVTKGQTLSLSAVASDPLDGPLSGSAIAWTVDAAILVGSGADLTLNTSSLQPGQHTLTVVATDSKSLTSQASITFSVVGAVLSIAKSHSGSFTKSQQNAEYLVIVSNATNATPTSGAVTVTETIPVGMTLVSMGGFGWMCSSNTCTRSDVLNPGMSYSTIAVTVNVAANPGPLLANQVTVSGGGSASAVATDLTTITGVLTNPVFGSFDTPLNNATSIVGAVGVTGWALATTGVSKLEIYRDPVGAEPTGKFGMIFVGTPTFVAGARPDVQAQYPSLPNANKAGWGYMLLTNFLPNNGNGSYRLHVIAYDAQGNPTEIGAPGKTINCDNVNAAKPFGTIDTPGQGDTISGKQYVNFGWSLTPGADFTIPTDGSTITVTVDGVPQGHATYNQFRNDIASLFPGYSNSNGAVGYFILDTSKLSAGVHTIAWLVYDDHGRGEGIGSRYFTVANGAATQPQTEEPSPQFLAAEDLRLRRGFDLSSSLEALVPNSEDSFSIRVEELGRIEIHGAIQSGYQVANGRREPLPIGSAIKAGVFYWQLGPGFLGEFRLAFTSASGRHLLVSVEVTPKSR